jgi:hypothetical protein
MSSYFTEDDLASIIQRLEKRVSTLELRDTVLNWNSFTPGTYGITLGAGGVQTAEYVQIGDLVHWFYEFLLGSGSAITGEVRMDMPVTGASAYGMCNGTLQLEDSSTSDFVGVLYRLNSTTVRLRAIDSSGAGIVKPVDLSPTVPFTWASGDRFYAAGTYKASS